MPANIVYEDEKHIAFLDRSPVNPGHTLVITKNHHVNILDIPEDELKELSAVVKKVTLAVLKAVEAHGVNVSMNNGRASGQLVNHIHWHIIPRFVSDGFKHWPHSKYQSGQAEEIEKRIKKALNFQ